MIDTKFVVGTVLRNVNTDEASLVTGYAENEAHLLKPLHLVGGIWSAALNRIVEVADLDPYEVANGAVTVEERMRLLGDLLAVARGQVVESDKRTVEVRYNHHKDIETIGAALLEQAEIRSWCEEYDNLVDQLNNDLTVSLPVRNHDYDVEVIMTYTTTVTVTARNADDAREQVEGWGEGDISLSYVTPDIEITDVNEA